MEISIFEEGRKIVPFGSFYFNNAPWRPIYTYRFGISTVR